MCKMEVIVLTYRFAVNLFIQQIFILHLLYTRDSARLWVGGMGHNNE